MIWSLVHPKQTSDWWVHYQTPNTCSEIWPRNSGIGARPRIRRASQVANQKRDTVSFRLNCISHSKNSRFHNSYLEKWLKRAFWTYLRKCHVLIRIYQETMGSTIIMTREVTSYDTERAHHVIHCHVTKSNHVILTKNCQGTWFSSGAMLT